MSKAKDFMSFLNEEKDPELHVSAHTGTPQNSSGGKGEGRVFSVIYQGQAMTASTLNWRSAVKTAQDISRQLGKNIKDIGYYDGDKGEFVGSIDDLVKK